MYGVTPHACSPMTAQSSSPCSTILSPKLLENAFTPAWKQVPKRGWWQLCNPAEVWKSKSLPWFDLRVNPGATNFCKKHRAQNLFMDPFTITHQTGHTSWGYINPRFKSMPWFSIKMLLPSITNPTAQSEKDTPQTSQQSVHPGMHKSEKSGSKSKMHQENMTTCDLKSFLIFDHKFHSMSKKPSRPLAWAYLLTVCFHESIFSNKNLFPMKTAHQR